MQTHNYDRLMEEARKRCQQFDEIDRQNGNEPPRRGPLLQHLETVEAALEAGLKRGDWTCAADALVLLREAVQRLSH